MKRWNAKTLKKLNFFRPWCIRLRWQTAQDAELRLTLTTQWQWQCSSNSHHLLQLFFSAYQTYYYVFSSVERLDAKLSRCPIISASGTLILIACSLGKERSGASKLTQVVELRRSNLGLNLIWETEKPFDHKNLSFTIIMIAVEIKITVILFVLGSCHRHYCFFGTKIISRPCELQKPWVTDSRFSR